MSDWINVGRPGPYGNPFIIGRDGSREEVVIKHRIWLLAPEQRSLRERMKGELKGKRFWCPGCKETLPCHRTIIEEIVNNQEVSHDV